jgi:hypothetical protein
MDIMTISRSKEKTPLLNVQLLQQKHQKRQPKKDMVIVTDYELILNTEKGVFCREFGAEFLPCCSGQLKVIGSRKRVCIDGLGVKIILIIRRLRCVECSRVHHELSDMLVPYKRHVRESIEATVRGDPDLI